MLSTLAADAVLIVHFAFVLFVTGGLAAIWLGALFRWSFVRNRTFRWLHLAAICFVAGEALAGVVCPLTLWEDALRGRRTETGFVARWVRSVLFYDLPEGVFTAGYITFAAVVAVTLFLIPPQKKKRAPERPFTSGKLDR